MAANLTLVLGGVIALFAVFMIALGYAQWSTWGMEVHREGK